MRTPPHHRHYKYLSAAAVALCLAISAAAEAKIYKWVDAGGTVHYSQTPPADRNFSEMPDVVPPPSTAGESQGQLQDMIDRQEATEEREVKDKKDAAAQAAKQVERANLCIQARDELAKLQKTPSNRFIIKQDDGTDGRMGDQERQNRIANMQKAIADSCD